jgi:hypothetical protein
LIADLIRCFEQWSEQTYEGRPISAAVGLDPEQVARKSSVTIDVLGEPYGLVMASGLDSILVVNRNRQVVHRVTLSPTEIGREIRAPLRFVALAHWARDKRTALSLTRLGEILLFRDGSLAFAKRRGTWCHFPHNAIISRARINKRFDSALIEAVLNSCLDVSFAKTGGGVGIVSRRARELISKAEMVKPKDRLSGHGNKAQFLRSMVSGKKFQSLDRKTRMDLMAIDGSMILLRDGTIYAVGAIIKIKAGSAGGGREAAARTAARYGLGIKVSSDGKISGFWRDNPRQRKSDVRFVVG